MVKISHVSNWKFAECTNYVHRCILLKNDYNTSWFNCINDSIFDNYYFKNYQVGVVKLRRALPPSDTTHYLPSDQLRSENPEVDGGKHIALLDVVPVFTKKLQLTMKKNIK